MTEAWELRTNDERVEDSLIIFIIFCEDDNSEPLYFESFALDKVIKINAIRNQKRAKLNLQNTVTKCVNDGLISFQNGAYHINEGIQENIWCIYDRDLENEDLALITQADNIAFDLAIQTAQVAGLKVAWSNDAFELWVLLHFEDLSTTQPIHRNFIYDRLTDIFKNLPDQSAELLLITQNPHFNYKGSFKKRMNFLTHVLPLLKDRTNIALQRAADIDNHYLASIPFHSKNPCTQVYHLVNELLVIHNAL